MLERDPGAAPCPRLLRPEDLLIPGVMTWARGLALSSPRQEPLALPDPGPCPGSLSESREVPGIRIAPLGGRDT